MKKISKKSIFITLIGLVILTINSAVLAVEPVIWTNIVNATVTGNSIQKNTGICADCANSGAVSQQQILSGNGYVELTMASDTKGYVGLGTTTTNSTSNQEINFGISFNNGLWVIRELNYTYRLEGNYNVGDTFRIAIVGSQVKYYKNGTTELYTSTVSPTYPLLVDTSFWYETGTPINKISNAMIETNQAAPVPTPPTIVSNRCSTYPAPTVPAPLRTFYIDAANGNDSNNGLTSATAWRTLQQANNNAIAGDLFLLRGVFINDWITPTNSGTATNKIVFKKEPGQSAVIDTGRFEGAVSLVGKSHIVIDGLEIRNVNYPIGLSENANNIWLRNLYIHNSGQTLLRGAQNNRIEDSVFVDIGNPQTNEGDSVILLTDSTGNTTANDNNFVVRNYFGNAGHAAYDDTNQGGSFGYNDNNVVAQNIFNNQWATNIAIGGRSHGTLLECNEIKNASQNTPNPQLIYPRPGIQYSGDNGIIRYNRVYNNKAYGISVEAYIWAATELQYPENNQFYHNTVVGNGSAGLFINISDSGYPSGQAYVRNNTFENNIFWNNAGYDGANGQFYDVIVNCYSANLPWAAGFTDGNIFRYNNTSNLPFLAVVRNTSGGGNLYFNTPASAQAAYPTWTNNRRDNPLFTNAATNDYSLLSNSPLIDVGRLISGVCYSGVAPDLGAVENCNTTPSQQAIVFNGINQYGLVTLPNTAPFNSLGGFQIIWRVRNVGSNNGRMFSSGFGGVIANGSTYTAFDWREGINMYMPPTNYADSICKLQFDPANSRWTFETWKADGTGYVSRTVAITNTSNYNLGGTDLAIGANTYGNSLFIQEKLDYWRWIQRVEPLGTFPGTSAPTGVTYLVKYEFDGSGNDSSGRGLNLNLFNNPTFENTP